jgi:ATP-binding cassette subfamily B protein RaxB
MQDDCLLSGSILDNVAFFDEHPDVELVNHVLRAASIFDEVSRFPMG